MKIKRKVERSGDALIKTVIFCDIYGSISRVNEGFLDVSGESKDGAAYTFRL